jgi:hypothetical protein
VGHGAKPKLISSWPGASTGARVIALTATVVLGYGTVAYVAYVAHLVTGGLDPYPYLPDGLGCYFVLLTLLDPTAAALLVLRRRSGVDLGCVLFVTEALANGCANYVLDHTDGITAGRIGQGIITTLAVILTDRSHQLWSSCPDRSSP